MKLFSPGHPCERIEAALDAIFAIIDWVLYGLLDRIIGTRHEVILKRKAKKLMKDAQK